MSAHHTPGPWFFEPGTIGDFPYVVYGEDALRVESGKDSDARLIAAAPDLLNLARAVADHFADTDAPLGIQARAAIAKATS